MALEERTALPVLEEAGRASDRIGAEKVDTKEGITKLFGLPEARGVAVASGEDVKPSPEAAKDDTWEASSLQLAGRAEMPPEMATIVDKLEFGQLATCWAKSTCWTAVATAAGKVGDVGDRTDEGMVDGADEATLECNGIEPLPEKFFGLQHERQGILGRRLTIECVCGVNHDK